MFGRKTGGWRWFGGGLEEGREQGVEGRRRTMGTWISISGSGMKEEGLCVVVGDVSK